MNPEAIREWLQRAPFQPFAMKLSNGDSYEIRHPAMILLGKREAVVYAPDNDRFSFVALLHVTNLAPLHNADQSRQ